MNGFGSFWRDRRVFVTGCTGLLGSWTVRSLLSRGAHVVGLVRDNTPGSDLVRSGDIRRIDVVRGRLENQKLLERALAEYEIETVMHLGAQTIVGTAVRSPVATFDANIRGTWTLLEAVRRVGRAVHIVVASSDKAYGAQDDLPYREAAPLLARHPYDVSKACADMIALSYHATYGLPVCVTRCGNFFGGGDLNWNRIVPGTIRSVLRGERPVVRSDGTPTRDYLYAADGAEAYLHLAECMAEDRSVWGEAFNFSTETPLSALDVVRRVMVAMGEVGEPEVRNEASHEIPHQFLSAEKARRLLGWRPRFRTFDDAVPDTVAWYRGFINGFDDDILTPERIAA